MRNNCRIFQVIDSPLDLVSRLQGSDSLLKLPRLGGAVAVTVCLSGVEHRGVDRSTCRVYGLFNHGIFFAPKASS